MQSPDLLAVFLEPLEKSGLNYFVTGSIAGIFYSEPRLTHDIDLVLNLPQSEVKSFLKLFPATEFYSPPEDVVQIEIRRQPYGHLNLIHHKTGFKADLYPDSGNNALRSWAFENRKRVEIRKDLSIWLAPLEYIIIRKLEFYREGASEKHINDIKKLIEYSGNEIDEGFLNKEIVARGLEAFWSKCGTK